MTRADYDWKIQDYGNKKLILIEDLNLGNMSVTNDIENVVDDICKTNQIVCEDYLIIYKDSEGIWDGWDCKKRNFIHLGGETWQQAFERL